MNNEYCIRIHEAINMLPKYLPQDVINITVENGIYFIFERGEEYNGYRRIVRVGINRENGRFASRLYDHFCNKNHRKSIFIMNIGRVFLYREQDDYIKIWDMKRPGTLKDDNKEQYYEDKASSYLKTNMSLSFIQIDDKGKREHFENAIIATLAQTDDFHPSTTWLGHDSPKTSIRKSGMWLTQGLNGTPLSEIELEELEALVHHN